MAITKATASSIAPAAKGDLVVGSATNDAGVLAVGTNTHILVADSTETLGMKWAAAAGGGANWSLLNSGGTALSGASTVTVSGISGKDKIMVLVEGAKGTGVQNACQLRLNGDTGSNYYQTGSEYEGASTYAASNMKNISITGTAHNIGSMSTNANSIVAGYVLITGCNAAGVKVLTSAGASTAAGGSSNNQYVLGGYYNSASTISSISIFNNTANFSAGTVYVYTSA